MKITFLHREFPKEWESILKIIKAKVVCFISDFYYVVIVGDRSTMYKQTKKWRHLARNPITGIFSKYL